MIFLITSYPVLGGQSTAFFTNILKFPGNRTRSFRLLAYLSQFFGNRTLFFIYFHKDQPETQTGDLLLGGPLWTVGSIVLRLHLEVGLGVLAHRAHRRRALGDLHVAAVTAEPHDLLTLLEDLALLQVVQQL